MQRQGLCCGLVASLFRLDCDVLAKWSDTGSHFPSSRLFQAFHTLILCIFMRGDQQVWQPIRCNTLPILEQPIGA